jgi:hypothetical protein
MRDITAARSRWQKAMTVGVMIRAGLMTLDNHHAYVVRDGRLRQMGRRSCRAQGVLIYSDPHQLAD